MLILVVALDCPLLVFVTVYLVIRGCPWLKTFNSMIETTSTIIIVKIIIINVSLLEISVVTKSFNY